MQHLEYLLYSFDNQRVYSYFHSTFLIYFLMEAGLPIIVHFLVADSSQKKRTFCLYKGIILILKYYKILILVKNKYTCIIKNGKYGICMAWNYLGFIYISP